MEEVHRKQKDLRYTEFMLIAKEQKQKFPKNIDH